MNIIQTIKGSIDVIDSNNEIIRQLNELLPYGISQLNQVFNGARYGRNFWKPALEYNGEVIFPGDYTDTYSYENFKAPLSVKNIRLLDNRQLYLLSNRQLTNYR